MADETDDESYDMLDGLGDREYGLCDDVAMAPRRFDDQSSTGCCRLGLDWVGFTGRRPRGRLSINIKLFFVVLGGPA